MPRRHPPDIVATALRLGAAGVPKAAIARELGVEPSTVRRWLRDPERASLRAASCPACQGDHGARPVPAEPYAYLLGAYLRDGHVSRIARSHLLRVSLDTAYPGIVSAVADAVEAVCGRRPAERPDYGGKRCVHLASTWRSWPCLFPQSGPGRKHDRPIVLVGWQQEIIDRHPQALLRGLIHSDGWRGLNRVHVRAGTTRIRATSSRIARTTSAGSSPTPATGSRSPGARGPLAHLGRPA